jgi:hypothetical protein
MDPVFVSIALLTCAFLFGLVQFMRKRAAIESEKIRNLPTYDRRTSAEQGALLEEVFPPGLKLSVTEAGDTIVVETVPPRAVAAGQWIFIAICAVVAIVSLSKSRIQDAVVGFAAAGFLSWLFRRLKATIRLGQGEVELLSPLAPRRRFAYAEIASTAVVRFKSSYIVEVKGTRRTVPGTRHRLHPRAGRRLGPANRARPSAGTERSRPSPRRNAR